MPGKPRLDDGARAVRGPVVDDDELVDEWYELVEDRGDGRLLVVRRDDRDAARCGHRVAAARAGVCRSVALRAPVSRALAVGNGNTLGAVPRERLGEPVPERRSR